MAGRTTKPGKRFIAKMICEALRQERFATYADLKDVVRSKLAKVRYRFEPDDFSAALEMVESNTELLITVHASRSARAAQSQ